MTLSPMKESENEHLCQLKNLSIGSHKKLLINEENCNRVDQLYSLSLFLFFYFLNYYF